MSHWHPGSILGEMKWGGTHEIQTILRCIFQLSWPFDRVNSATSVTVRQLSVTPAPLPTSVVFPSWKTRCCSCLLGTQDVLQATQYLAIRNWQPLNCHSSKQLNAVTLNKTCQAKHADVTNKSRHLFVLAKKKKKREPQTGSLWPYRFPHVLYAHARAHTPQCTLRAYPRSSDFKRNKEIKRNELQTHQAFHGL